MNTSINLNDKVIMKKQHACGTNEWTITRVGADVKIKWKKRYKDITTSHTNVWNFSHNSNIS